MFKGLPFKNPEIEVILPQSNKKYLVRAMNKGKETNIKTTIMNSPTAIISKWTSIIYDSIVSPDKPSYQEFIKNTTTIDRDSIIFGLYEITYGDEYIINNFECPACGHNQTLKYNLSKGFELFRYPEDAKESILEKRVKVQLSEDVYAYVFQPTCQYEQDFFADLNPNDMGEDIEWKIIVDKFEYKEGDEVKTLSFYDNKIDFNMALNQLLPKMVADIFKAYIDNFGKYRAECTVKYKCTECGHLTEFKLDFVKQFFRMVSRPLQQYQL